MQVDTGEFAALVEEVAAVGRKVSTLTGRLTIMSSRLHHLDAEVAEKIAVFARFLVAQGFVRPPEERHESQHARPRRDRHGMRSVGGDRR